MEPILSSLIFYAIVVSFCELSRRVLDYLYGAGPQPPSTIKGFLTEAIGTAQAIACVYENQLIVKNYGLIGFVVVVFLLLNLHRQTNRGSVISPTALTERAFTGQLKPIDAVYVFLAELAGGAIALRLAKLVWMLGISPEQAAHGGAFKCVIMHKVPIVLVAAYEFFAVFLIRSFVGYMSRTRPKWTPYAAAAAVSIGLATGMALVGPVGLNPIIAFGRLGGCEGLSHSGHLATYWAAPMAGWMCAAFVERFLSRQKKVR